MGGWEEVYCSSGSVSYRLLFCNIWLSVLWQILHVALSRFMKMLNVNICTRPSLCGNDSHMLRASFLPTRPSMVTLTTRGRIEMWALLFGRLNIVNVQRMTWVKLSILRWATVHVKRESHCVKAEWFFNWILKKKQYLFCFSFRKKEKSDIKMCFLSSKWSCPQCSKLIFRSVWFWVFQFNSIQSYVHQKEDKNLQDPTANWLHCSDI